ncbi:CaiB/BaiF CoA transferase family protein [Phreatobacter stygius]|nr:CoA transferase [Phreatobacter stygius]
MQSPLADVRVVDLSELLPGPYATQLLGDLGATVIKVERPAGDNARAMLPGLFAAVNRGKESVVIDLKSEDGRRRFRDLVADADVMVEGFRPGVAERLGVDYATLSKINPRLVYVSLTGYGQQGAMADQPGHDLNYLAASGVLGLMPPPEPGRPHGLGLPVGDLAGSMFAVVSVLAALMQRQHSGRGQYLDVSITDALSHWMTPRLGMILRDGAGQMHQRPGYGFFQCADGRMLVLAAMEDHFWTRLVDLLDLAEFAGPAFATYRQRQAAFEAIKARLDQEFRAQPLAAWLKQLQAHDIPANGLATPEETLDDPEGRVIGRDGKDLIARFPVPMHALPPAARHAPALGAHTPDPGANILLRAGTAEVEARS